MRIAVTGANGSIGSRVVKLALENGHKVMAIDSTPSRSQFSGDDYTFYQVDLRDYEATLKHLNGCEAVIQLAAIRTPEDYKVLTHNTNVVLSWNVLRACAELGITRIAQASSVNVVTLVFSHESRLRYFPIDEDHPCEPDEPYGLSKIIAELQADTIVRRYPNLRIASLRLSYSLPAPFDVSAEEADPTTQKDLWGWVQEDSGAKAFLLAVTHETDAWKGHEVFFIASTTLRVRGNIDELKARHYAHIPIREGKDLSKGFFDCDKAKRLLGWVHEP